MPCCLPISHTHYSLPPGYPACTPACQSVAAQPAPLTHSLQPAPLPAPLPAKQLLRSLPLSACTQRSLLRVLRLADWAAVQQVKAAVATGRGRGPSEVNARAVRDQLVELKEELLQLYRDVLPPMSEEELMAEIQVTRQGWGR